LDSPAGKLTGGHGPQPWPATEGDRDVADRRLALERAKSGDQQVDGCTVGCLDARAAEVFDVFAIMLIIGLRDWRTAPSPGTSRTRHFCTMCIGTTFVAFPATRPSPCGAQRSNAARRSGNRVAISYRYRYRYRDRETIALDVRVVLLVIRAVHLRPDLLTPTAAE
jgi:hypothetical protein